MLLVSVYGGYFGAGVGIIALAVLALERSEPLAVTNAVKNAATGAANGAAAIAYLLFAPVDWRAALALGSGAVVGGTVGPAIVRVAPERALRWSDSRGSRWRRGWPGVPTSSGVQRGPDQRSGSIGPWTMSTSGPTASTT